MKCKDCGKEEKRIPVLNAVVQEVQFDGADSGKRWRGRRCPECWRKYTREATRRYRERLKQKCK